MPGENAESSFERRRDAVRAFCDQSAHDLLREVEPFVFENVVQTLAESVAKDIRVITGFISPSIELPEGELTNDNPAIIHVPISPLFQELYMLASDLDAHWKIGGDRSGLFDYSRFDHSYVALLYKAHERYGNDALKLLNMIFFIASRDILFNVGLQPSLQREYDRSSSEDTPYMIAMNGLSQDPPSDESVMSLVPLCGEDIAMRRIETLHHRTISTELRLYERLMAQSAQIRDRARVMLMHYPMFVPSRLSDAIVRQGYRTLLTIDEVNEYDLWEKVINDYQWEAMRRGDTQAASGENLLEPDSSLPSGWQYLDANEQAAWTKGIEYLKTHEPQPRMKLRDKLECARNAQELDKLRGYNWPDAVGAKQREITTRVFSEVIRFAYARGESPGEEYQQESYRFGTPVYAAENRRLTCFTGVWLMAALCQESGIPYNQMFYCNVHEYTHPEGASQQRGTHAALLVLYDDGGMTFLDYGYQKCGRSFSSGIIPDPVQRRKFRSMLDRSRISAEIGRKLHADHARVTLPKKTAAAMRMYEDMDVLPLDQGFAAGMMLHTGIALQAEEKNDEAVHAFQLGLATSPMDPNLLCRLAMTCLEKNDDDRADCYLRTLLGLYPAHSLGLYYAGVLALKRQDDTKALMYFQKVAADESDMWGDDTYREQARRYVELKKSVCEAGQY